MKPIRVGIDASGLATDKPATGLQRYTSCLLSALASNMEDSGIALYLYFSGPVQPMYYAAEQPLSKMLPGPALHWRMAPFARGWQRFGMGLAMHLDNLDLFHFPAPRMARYCPMPSVVTIHDLAALSLKGEQTSKERMYLPDALDAGRRATSLIAVSQSAGEEVVKYLNRPDVTVIPEGVDLTHFRPAAPAKVAAISQKYHLDCYILCVGTLQTRKNHLGLIQAFERIQHQVSHTLVIAGHEGSGAQAIQDYLREHPDLRVRCIGYVEDADLPALYTGADVLVWPSFWEGFGLPLIEAMACGTPVLTSNISSLVEVAGNAALLVDPHNLEDMARQLLSLLTDEALQKRLIQAGFERAQSMSWDHAAQETVAVYTRTVGNKKT